MRFGLLDVRINQLQPGELVLIQGGGGSWAEADPPGLIYQSPATARVDYNLQKKKKSH